MELKELKKLFLEHVEKNPLVTSKSKIAKGYGASNSIKIVESGVELIDADMDRILPDIDCFVLITSTKLPPNDDLYVAVFIRKDASTFHQKLEEMITIGKQEEAANIPKNKKTHAIINNNTAILVSPDGKLYLRNKGRWVGSKDEIDLNSFAPCVAIDRVEIAVYPLQRDAARSLNIRTYISYLSKLFGHDYVHEIHPWTVEESDLDKYKVDLSNLAVNTINKRIEELGYYNATGIVKRFHIALNHLKHKHFVILSGMSGTGKTSLAIKYSQAVHGIEDSEKKDPFLFICRVRPDWTDPTGLIGYHDIISGKYIVPEFLEAILTAHAYPDIPVFVCLDEMNLARVEYYFSDMLSCIESSPESHITLHHNSIPMEGSTGEDIPASIPFPVNLYVIGTINVDETTNPLSNKILDRANVIDMSSVNIKGFLDDLINREPDLKSSIKKVKDILIGINEILMPNNLGFGYRVAEEFTRYFYYALKVDNTSENETIDHLLSQKILTKLKGTERKRPMINSLIKFCSEYNESTEILNRLLEELDEFSGFQTLR
jgi:5-methylcytosine-specific restriction enzyme B